MFRIAATVSVAAFSVLMATHFLWQEAPWRHQAGTSKSQAAECCILEDYSLKGRFEYNKAHSELGDTDAMSELAFAYENGEGTNIDYDAALTWLERAFEAGGLNAASMLAYRHKKGLISEHPDSKGKVIVAQDHERAQQLYKEYWTRVKSAAERGDPDAMYRLSRLYKDGHEGIAMKDLVQAVEWERKSFAAVKAQANEDTDSKFMLAILYKMGGSGIKQNAAEANRLLRELADAGHYEATMGLADTFTLRLSSSDDDYLDEASIKLIGQVRDFADKGDLEAMEHLKDIYDHFEDAFDSEMIVTLHEGILEQDPSAISSAETLAKYAARNGKPAEAFSYLMYALTNPDSSSLFLSSMLVDRLFQIMNVKGPTELGTFSEDKGIEEWFAKQPESFQHNNLKIVFDIGKGMVDKIEHAEGVDLIPLARVARSMANAFHDDSHGIGVTKEMVEHYVEMAQVAQRKRRS